MKRVLTFAFAFAAVALLAASPASANQSSPPGAERCIRVTGNATAGAGHSSTAFWSYFKNVCGRTVTATFDVLLFWCADQTPPGGQCFFDHDLKVDEEVTLTFAPYQTQVIRRAMPPTLQCGFYQWDVNFKPAGCTNHGDCWTKAKGLPGTSGQIFEQRLNCQTWVCQPGARKACAAGCGDVICTANGQWNSGACTGKNRCGGCGKAPQCCAGETKACASGCGTVTCKADGSWDNAQCAARDACGQCPGPGAKPCCPGPAPECADCESAKCTDQGWVCEQTAPPACGSDCTEAACVDGKWACRKKAPLDCGVCETPTCEQNAWVCKTQPNPADDVSCGKGIQPPQDLPPPAAPLPPPLGAEGGCDCRVGATPDAGLVVTPLLLLALALLRRRER